MRRSTLAGFAGVIGWMATGCVGSVAGGPGGTSGNNHGGTGAATGTGANTGNTGGGTGNVPGGTGATTGGAGAVTGGGGSGIGGGGSIGFTGPASQYSALRKIKGVLTGLAPTDADVATGREAAGLRALIDAWMATPEFQNKMILFFGNTFQQTSLAVLDFEFQLRKRPGAFDLPYAIFGDNAFPLLFKNMKESFARTALQLIADGRPLTDALTTTQFMMTTALKSMYMQIEMPNNRTPTFTFNHGARPTYDAAAVTAATFGFAAPATTTGRTFAGNCAGDATRTSTFTGSTLLFQVLLGSIPRDAATTPGAVTQNGCMEHAAQPYFTASDLSDWKMVNIVNVGTPILSYDLPRLRAATTLPSKLPRVSFFTTPAFLAVWNTNDSNQHRVTANQALLAALGQGFTNAATIIPTPPSTVGLDGTHAVTGSVCYGCHKSLDPMKMFWQNSYDFNDQVATRPGTAASFGFGNVSQNGVTLVDFGTFMSMVTDAQVAAQPVNRFALALTQKLCFFANSARCEETDPEMRRVASAFQTSNFDFKTLVRELFSSPLVTVSASTATFAANGVTISIARRDQLCAALSSRLGKVDLCDITTPAPTEVTSATNKLAGAIPADAFSRGSEFPVTAPDPNLFYRAASELVCEAVSRAVVDATTGTVYSSTAVATAIPDMVQKVMGVPPTDPNYAASVKVLMDHYTAATTTARATPTNALRSVFSAACQSPPSLALGI